MSLAGFDWDGPWGRVAFDVATWGEVFAKLDNFNTMRWQEIIAATGSVKSGNNNHHIEVSRLTAQAQKRITDLQLDIDTVFSIHLRGPLRSYGIRDRKLFKLLWIDPWHDKERGVYPYG